MTLTAKGFLVDGVPKTPYNTHINNAIGADMLNATQRRLLQEAIAKLEEASQLVVDALGESDATQYTCTGIQEIVAELEEDLA